MKFVEKLCVPDIYYFDFDRENLTKPWKDPNAGNLEDYFNHGFNEETFRHYQAKMKQNDEKYGANLAEEETLMNMLSGGDDQHPEEKDLYHKSLNFVLPHELGGCGSAYFEPEKDIYGLFNIFAAGADLAVIEPRWTTKDEFKVKLPRNKALDEPLEEDVAAEEPYSALPRANRESLGEMARKPAIYHKHQ